MLDPETALNLTLFYYFLKYKSNSLKFTCFFTIFFSVRPTNSLKFNCFFIFIFSSVRSTNRLKFFHWLLGPKALRKTRSCCQGSTSRISPTHNSVAMLGMPNSLPGVLWRHSFVARDSQKHVTIRKGSKSTWWNFF